MAVFANVDTLSESDQDAPPMQKSKAKAKPKSPVASVKAKSSPSKPKPGPQKAKAKSVLQTGSKLKKPAARKRPAAASDGEPGDGPSHTTAALVKRSAAGEDSDGGVEPGDDSGLGAALKRPAAAVAGDDGSNPGDEPGDAPDGAPSCSKQPKVSCIYLYKATGKFAVKRDGKQIFQANHHQSNIVSQSGLEAHLISVKFPISFLMRQVGGNHVNSDKAKEIADLASVTFLWHDDVPFNLRLKSY